MDGYLPVTACRHRLALAVGFIVASLALQLPAAELGRVALFDGEQREPLNRWGGLWTPGTVKGVGLQSEYVHAGRGALAVDLGPLAAGQSAFARLNACAAGSHDNYGQTRDLARYRQLSLHVLNATRGALRGCLEVRDHRQSSEHRAAYRFELPDGARWAGIEIPLPALDAARAKELASGWTIIGSPDWARVTSLDFHFEPAATITGGRVFLDDLQLLERGAEIDIDTAPAMALAERVARRQWEGLWAARSREHGLLPNTSYQVRDAALNNTSAMLWMLPAATRRGWIAPAEAHAYMAQVLKTVDRLMEKARYLPPRHVDWVTLDPSVLPEESVIDTAFLALALHHYKSLPSTPAALRTEIDRTQNRFDFAAFACPGGWKMAYRYAAQGRPAGFVEWIYDGYTNESNVISLAAHLSTRHGLPIETNWNTNVRRVRTQLAGFEQPPVVHTDKQFRAPFAQALLNLYVDVRERGIDTFPDHGLAANPWRNFVDYQQWVMTRLTAQGRRGMVQPDAGDDGSLGNYQQFSLYDDFGQPDLFMPWSVSFALLAGADGAEDALRFLLRNQLHGPLGLADSAHWTTGEAGPSSVTVRHDLWNTSLSTMALLEWLDGNARLSKSFAALPEVRTALDRVFRPAGKSRTPVVQTALQEAVGSRQ